MQNLAPPFEKSNPSNFGPSYRREFDARRLHSKQDKLRDFMLGINERFLTLAEIQARLEAQFRERFPTPSVSAYLRHLKKKQFGSFVLEKRRRSGAACDGLWEYRLSPPKSPTDLQGGLFVLADQVPSA
jgi:hypothetical protein